MKFKELKLGSEFTYNIDDVRVIAGYLAANGFDVVRVFDGLFMNEFAHLPRNSAGLLLREIKKIADILNGDNMPIDQLWEKLIPK